MHGHYDDAELARLQAEITRRNRQLEFLLQMNQREMVRGLTWLTGTHPDVFDELHREICGQRAEAEFGRILKDG